MIFNLIKLLIIIILIKCSYVLFDNQRQIFKREYTNDFYSVNFRQKKAEN